jgi:peptidoglycan/xylan/chitin deacetylase (PgdA/CDA1 family)
VLPLGAALDGLATGKLPARAVSLTFDDGYADNHDHALPVLARHGLTATFFIASGFLDGGRMWNDSIAESIRRCGSDSLDLSATVAGSLGVLPLASANDRRKAVASIIRASKYQPLAIRDDWVSTVAQRCAAELPVDLMMTSEQVRVLHQRGMTIGAHTVSHPILRGLSLPSLISEIDDGRRALQQIVGAPVRLFAYPNGRPGVDYDEETVSVVKELGFDAAVSTAWRAAGRKDDRFQLPRYMPWERTRTRFGFRMVHTLATT